MSTQFKCEWTESVIVDTGDTCSGLILTQSVDLQAKSQKNALLNASIIKHRWAAISYAYLYTMKLGLKM